MIVTVIAGLYHALVYAAQKVKIGFLSAWALHTAISYSPCSSKYRCRTAVANANGVLVRLICEGSGPGYIRSCLVLVLVLR